MFVEDGQIRVFSDLDGPTRVSTASCFDEHALAGHDGSVERDRIVGLDLYDHQSLNVDAPAP